MCFPRLNSHMLISIYMAPLIDSSPLPLQKDQFAKTTEEKSSAERIVPSHSAENQP